jgi:hypothetical protein
MTPAEKPDINDAIRHLQASMELREGCMYCKLSMNDAREILTALDSAARLERQLSEARETNKRLHGRCQQAEAAAADAHRIIKEHWEQPWCGGSIGRALLAHRFSVLERQRDGLLEAAKGLIEVCEPNIYPQPDKPDSAWGRLQAARAAIAACEPPNPAP